MGQSLATFIFCYIVTVGVIITDDFRAAMHFEGVYVGKNTGYRYVHNILTQLQVLNLADCAFHCTNLGCCTAFNYRQHFQIMSTNPWNCEIIAETKDSNLKLLERNSEYSFYEIIENKCLNGGKCEVNSSNNFGHSCLCPCSYFGRRCEKHKAFRSCKELSNCKSKSGEYDLQLQFPTCNKSVRVFCADMNTPDPKEYITLKSGEENNFSHLDNTMSPQEFNHYGSTTKFSKIRITVDLKVVTTDHVFAHLTWNDTKVIFERYGSAGDCIAKTCTTSKVGAFMMDIRGTGLHFSTPIKWYYSGWPNECEGQQPLNYNIDVQKQVVSGNCGTRCGFCAADDLFLKIEGC